MDESELTRSSTSRSSPRKRLNACRRAVPCKFTGAGKAVQRSAGRGGGSGCSLAAVQREAVPLFSWEGFKLEEIAEMTGVDMEKSSDDELDALLRQGEPAWKPSPLLDVRVWERYRRRPWEWLWRGSIRIPVPVAVMVVLLAVRAWNRAARERPVDIDLNEFRPVEKCASIAYFFY